MEDKIDDKSQSGSRCLTYTSLHPLNFSSFRFGLKATNTLTCLGLSFPTTALNSSTQRRFSVKSTLFCKNLYSFPSIHRHVNSVATRCFSNFRNKTILFLFFFSLFTFSADTGFPVKESNPRSRSFNSNKNLTSEFVIDEMTSNNLEVFDEPLAAAVDIAALPRLKRAARRTKSKLKKPRSKSQKKKNTKQKNKKKNKHSSSKRIDMNAMKGKHPIHQQNIYANPRKRLYNRSRYSAFHLAVLKNGRVGGEESSIGSNYTILDIKSVGENNTFTIKGVLANRYICVSKKGSVRARKSYKKSKCRFHEQVLENKWNAYESLSCKGCYLNLDKKGKMKRLKSTQPNSRRTHFLPRY